MFRRFTLYFFFPAMVLLAFPLSAGDYVIGPDDVLSITVLGEKDLSKGFTVSSKGTIVYPLLGELKVEGLSTDEVDELITRKLKKDYIKNPQVTVLIKEYKSKRVFIYGRLSKPGYYGVKEKTTLLELLTKIGGISPFEGSRVIITRGEGRSKIIKVDLNALLIKGDVSHNPPIKAGDFICISSDEKEIYILGQVEKPGPYKIEGRVTVLKAINLAGGLTDYAASNRIKVIRKGKAGKKTIKVKFSDILRGDRSKDIDLKPGDVILVPERWF